MSAGCFVVIDGPSGIGKSTVAAGLCDELARQGLAVLATREPSDSALGRLAREGTEEYQGTALACLVAADRYHHIKREILPALRAGHVVVCDRYVPSSLVLQRMDGVERSFLAQLNRYALPPDLTVILTGRPEWSAARAAERGTYSRFHRGGQAAAVEDRLYREVARGLERAALRVLQHEVSGQSAEAVTAVVSRAVLTLLDERSG